MRVHLVTDDLIRSGRAAFKAYADGLICGAGTPAYGVAMAREGGAQLVPGAVLACLERGITHVDDVVRAVARACRCRWWTAEAVLEQLGSGRGALWRMERGRLVAV